MSATTWTYRTAQDEADQSAIDDAIYQSFFGFGRPRPAMRKSTDWLGRENLRVIEQDGRIAGGLGLLPFAQWFGGKSVPSIGLSAVTVLPEYRGTGAGKYLIEQTVREMHASGAPLSVLYPSTWAFYRHAGYEIAGSRTTYKFDLRKLGVHDVERTMRPMENADVEAVRRGYTQIARTQNGMADRSETNWARVFRECTENEFRYVVEGPDGISGHLIYEQNLDREKPGELLIRDLNWLDPPSGRRILTFLQQHAILAEPVWFDGAPVDPLLGLARVENLETPYNHYWMLRLLDVRKALLARGYPAGLTGSLSFEVHDPTLEPNNGRFVLHLSDGQPAIEPGGSGGLTLGPRGWGPLFSGHLSGFDLRRMDLLAGSDADCATATQMFSGPRPWMNDRF